MSTADSDIKPDVTGEAAVSAAESTAQSTSAVEVHVFCRYLRRVIADLLEDVADESADADTSLSKSSIESAEALTNALVDRTSIESIRKFITEPQSPVLVVFKYPAKEEEFSTKDSSAIPAGSYEITTDLHFINNKVQCLVFTKKVQIIEPKRISSQVQVSQLEEGSPYTSFHSLVSQVLAPYFKSYVRSTATGASGGPAAVDKMAPTIEKKLDELELGLLQQQQAVEIPEVHLAPHPHVSKVVAACQQERRRVTVEDFADRLDDDAFLNQLQAGVNKWIQEILKVTRLDRDPSTGSSMQETNFWLSMERALLRIQEKRDSQEVTLTLEILKQRRRFGATLQFDSDTNLKPALALVVDYNSLMKDMPLNELFAASDLERLRAAVSGVLLHLKRVRSSRYPIARCYRLIEAVSRDLNAQILRVLGTRRLLHVNFEEFEAEMGAADQLFSKWDEECERLMSTLREIAKKKREDIKTHAGRLNLAHKRLQTRLENLKKFRQQHEQLRQVIGRVLRPQAVGAGPKAGGEQPAPETPIEFADISPIEEMAAAYEIMKEVDYLDLSKEGAEAWDAALKRYEERIDRIEARITLLLRNQLASAKSANEMFRIFQRFNALFVRPRIRGAIREYQAQLLQRVKEDIDTLHETFRASQSKQQRYYQENVGGGGGAGGAHAAQHAAHEIAHVRDLPPVTSAVVWARQIERLLSTYMRRVEDVLGRGWEQHVDGHRLKSESDAFRGELNTQEIFEEWCRRVQSKGKSTAGGRLFNIDKVSQKLAPKRPDEAPRTVALLKLRVNFLPEVIQLAKEVRNLKCYGFRVPLTIVNMAHQANQQYPYAIQLIESVRVYENTMQKLESQVQLAPAAHMQSVMTLVAGLRRDIQIAITEGLALTWDSYKLEQFVRRFAEIMFNFQERVEDVLKMAHEVDREVKLLETSAYSWPVFNELLARIQRHVDELSNKQFSNVAHWVARLDEEIERRLVQRLHAALGYFARAIEQRLQAGGTSGGGGGAGEAPEESAAEREAAAQAALYEPQLRLPELRHELVLQNQLISLQPPLEHARVALYRALFEWQNVVLALPRVQYSRFKQVAPGGEGLLEALEAAEALRERTYRAALARLPAGGQQLARAYAAMEEAVRAARDYVDTWTNYQALWDLQGEQLYAPLGASLRRWINVLEEIKQMRRHFDTSEASREFGPLVVVFSRVQGKVSMKYDAWHKEVLAKFAALLSGELTTFNANVGKSRGELEQRTLDADSTGEAVAFITSVQALKRRSKLYEHQMQLYIEGQRVLERQRFQFPQNWLYSENVNGQWTSFSEILTRKESQIQSQVASLQMKVVNEDKAVENRTNELMSEWAREKPTAGNMRPDAAAKQLALMETKLAKLKEERAALRKAREALEMSDLGSRNSDEQVQTTEEELQDLKQVWSAVTCIWDEVEQMRDTPWNSLQPRKIRQQLEALSTKQKEMPARLRQYESYDHVRKQLQSFAKVNVLVQELKSEAVRERHWKQLTKRLGVNWLLPELTLGAVWDADLNRHETEVKDVLAIAQGEMALEEFLKMVADVWHNYKLDLINYQNKCQLIRGWDELFTKVKEHTNSLQAMKFSPYYKQFEEEAKAWDEKLGRVQTVFDIWIDVQRRWVYLDGIFSGGTDIKALLPTESQRFASICTEFLGLMKKVAKSSQVMEVLNIPNLQRMLERLADLLSKVQKALGEYLERERSSFARFYFVGDEDLLDIIGNSKNIAKLQKHFKKMFAGVNGLILNADESFVEGVHSKEMEEMRFDTRVQIADKRINEWLAQVEREIRLTLARNLARCVGELLELYRVARERAEQLTDAMLIAWVDRYQAQIVVLAAQIAWSEGVEGVLAQFGAGKLAAEPHPLGQMASLVEHVLNVLADTVLFEQPPVRRRKLEHLITELVHQRDVTRALVRQKIQSQRAFPWLQQMRFYFDTAKLDDPLHQLRIEMANARFYYGFEYLGIQDKLVQTPLTDRCYLTMTQALEARLGGSPFGPAGTGKTESVKALGNQLGRFVLVFNCDETFDFQAMGRIFVGLCQVGAWGCFDEFNRLEERMLSAVSQQIQSIQESLREFTNLSRGKDAGQITVELVGKTVAVNPDMAIFITMNPGYAGRSNLPDNLKKLFRSLAMVQPDRQLIAEVMLFSQGFRTAEKLATKIVPFFKLCSEQLSPQSHYDFGLRALKSVLISAGNVKRDRLRALKEKCDTQGSQLDSNTVAQKIDEQEILIQSTMETMVPKLVAEDIPLLHSLLSDVFPGVRYVEAEMELLRATIKKVCAEMHLAYGDESESGGARANVWVEKVLQLYQITCIHHGVMMVGPSGSGKSAAWRVLLKALERVENVEGVAHLIDPKSITKEALYGNLDPNTREWTDGLFTATLRKIIDNVRGEINKRQWIIFDGDVDPEWCENMNSVLDDNKLLTLPNGERLAIPPNVRLMFEVQDLKYATLATVSRCGMVWFSDETVSVQMMFDHFLSKLNNVSLDEDEEGGGPKVSAPFLTGDKDAGDAGGLVSETVSVQRQVASVLVAYMSSNEGLVLKCLERAVSLDHIMDWTRVRALGSLFSMLNQSVRNVLLYNQHHPDFPMKQDQMERYISKYLVYSLVWSFAGDCKLKQRQELGDYIRSITTIQLPPNAQLPLIDYEVAPTGEWVPWQSKVPSIEVETHRVGAPDVVIPTLDTVRHESLLNTWLAEHKPMVLCGPPGSGKTMTLLNALRSLPDMDVVGLNFSSATTPEFMLKHLDTYCETRRTPNGLVLSPKQLNKWLVIFCDEINLPDMDKYGTQRVISFLRQLLEHGGFYSSDQQWVRYERVQFVGACNPPTDPGRKPLSHRFLRHVPVIYVDYPAEASLKQIYGTFNRAMLRLIPALKGYADPLTNAMVEFFLSTQERYTQEQQPHYIYSPRELTRWVRGVCEAIRPLAQLTLEGLVRLWAHEALRLFHDRLVGDDERRWTEAQVDTVAVKHFPNVAREEALKRPILFSNWLTRDYLPVRQEELRDYVSARIKVFCDEELDVPLVLFNEVLDHVLRIDRVFRQPQGHMLLIGVSGAGKTTLSRFVAWINGLSVFQVHNKYTAADFDDDLRDVLRRSGCRGEKIAFIMDESNVLDSSFLERMNTLLANGEVPGLFEGDEYNTLMNQCKEGAARDGASTGSNEELYKWFTNQICKNLHVVFTMNPSTSGLKDRAATSPALFNRCVINWFGDWSSSALYQVGRQLTSKVDLDKSDYSPPDVPSLFAPELRAQKTPLTHRDAVVNAFVFVHRTLFEANSRLQKRGGRTMAITPRQFLDLINHFVKLFAEKRGELEEEQHHVTVGLQRIRDTYEQVQTLQASLSKKRLELESKKQEANRKLAQLIDDQKTNEQKRAESTKLREQLQQSERHIAERQAEVKKQLDSVEPTLQDAKQAVNGISRPALVELKSLQNPPPLVKFTVEAVSTLLGESSPDWKALRGLITKENFVPTVINFKTEDIQPKIREKMAQYINNPDFVFEKVNKSSQVCGPLVKWVRAQVIYSELLSQIDPLRLQLEQLRHSLEQNKREAEFCDNEIVHLNERIQVLQEDYSRLIYEVKTIESDLTAVEQKVERSVALLKSLGSEQKRWEESSLKFKEQMSSIVGDVLLSSAFLAYAGYYDQLLRQLLLDAWSLHLHAANIVHRDQLALTEYLSNADEHIRWQENTLPTDDLCKENAIMLKRFNRYPLIIDPSGQATEFVLNEYKEKKIIKTSFLDDAFRKNLESALRFGNPLLVQDVENYDPILNPVLNREVRRSGGRVLISLGDQDIDLSPSFTIFLSTRDPSIEFAPDLCSRVTFVNFTVTRASLHSQCLNQALRAERPDIDAKRTDLLRLQGEFQLRLRHLEKDLLRALNEAKGNILEDNSIIAHLETLKKEAQEVAKKMNETDRVIKEVEQVSSQYEALALYSSAIYFTLESLNQMHFLYQFSLQFFLEIFTNVLLNNPRLSGVTDHATRLSIITSDLFQITYARVRRSMLHSDRITFAVLLARIYLKGLRGESAYDLEFHHFLRGQQEATVAAAAALVSQAQRIDRLNDLQNAALQRLAKLPTFRNIVQNVQSNEEFFNWLAELSPEENVPALWEVRSKTPPSAILEAVNRLLVVQAFRPDRLMSATAKLVNAVLGDRFSSIDKHELNMAEIIDQEIKPSTPVLMCSVMGYDASGRIEDLAAELGRQLTSIAIGSAEGFAQAEKTLSAAAKSGARWVMLKNVHLAPQWLLQLEKKLYTLQPAAGFRLFLTMEIHPKLPLNLLRAGRICVFEPPPGVRASLLRTFSTMPPPRMAKAPLERARLYFLLAWFHALVVERLRYSPLGWSKRYEFNESDLKCACDTIDSWVDVASGGRTNLPPDRIPWDALRVLLSQCIYGGKIDNDFDLRLLTTFLNRLFVPASFEADFTLVRDTEGAVAKRIIAPEAVRREEFIAWIESSLAGTQTPSWLGLPNNAEKLLLTNLGQEMINKILKMQMLEDDEELRSIGKGASVDRRRSTMAAPIGGGAELMIGGPEARPQWMRTLQTSVDVWLGTLPRVLQTFERTADALRDPLFRFFDRELNAAARLLVSVRRDLDDVLSICQGQRKPTNFQRELMADLTRGIVPNSWRRYVLPPNLTVIQWMHDFAARVKQFAGIRESVHQRGIGTLRSCRIWLGGLLMPEAYITATRQLVAQTNSWSLEELQLAVEVPSEEDISAVGGLDGLVSGLDKFSFLISGLRLQGATCKEKNVLEISNELYTELAAVKLRWVHVTDSSAATSTTSVSIPVYLNASRSNLLFTLDFETRSARKPDAPASEFANFAAEIAFYERGVALVASVLC